MVAHQRGLTARRHGRWGRRSRQPESGFNLAGKLVAEVEKPATGEWQLCAGSGGGAGVCVAPPCLVERVEKTLARPRGERFAGGGEQDVMARMYIVPGDTLQQEWITRRRQRMQRGGMDRVADGLDQR